jgi:SWI/SNF-related matrix-associated actin-dependent regulator of chromatin subfamily A3
MRQFRSSIVIPYDQGDDITAIERLVLLNDSLCLRRTRDLIKLPDLDEKVRRLDFNEAEREQYEKTMATLLRKLRQKVGEHEQTSKFGLFQVQLQLRILCNHGTFQKSFSWVSQRDANEAILSSGVGNAQIKCDGCQWPMPVLGSNKVYNEFVEQCKHVLCHDCLEEAATSQDTDSNQKQCPLCNAPQAVAAKNSARSHNNTTRRGADGELDDLDYFNKDGHSTKMDALIKDVKIDLNQTKR